MQTGQVLSHSQVGNLSIVILSCSSFSSEMVLLFATLYQNEGLDRKMAVDRAEKIFSNLDVNNDGDITEEEFVRGCLKVRGKADIGMISTVLFDIFKDEEMRRLLYETNSETLLSGLSTPTSN